MAMDRRGFCRLAGLTVLGVAGASSPSARAQAPRSGDAAAVADPIIGKRWAMVVDLQACRKEEGCRDCIKACHQVHNVPERGVVELPSREPTQQTLAVHSR